MDFKVYRKGFPDRPAALSLRDMTRLYMEGMSNRQIKATMFLGAEDYSFARFLETADISDLFVAGYEDGQPVAVVYITHRVGDSARVHFLIYGAGIMMRHCIGRQFMDFLYPALDVRSLLGFIPVVNRGARRFMQELTRGSVVTKSMGIIPGAFWLEKTNRAIDVEQFLFIPGEE
jgi:hypothetical protein